MSCRGSPLARPNCERQETRETTDLLPRKAAEKTTERHGRVMRINSWHSVKAKLAVLPFSVTHKNNGASSFKYFRFDEVRHNSSFVRIIINSLCP
jgi:hypothetical protein